MIPALLLSAVGLVLLRTSFAANPDPRVVLADLIGGRGGSILPPTGQITEADLSADRRLAERVLREQTSGSRQPTSRNQAVIE